MALVASRRLQLDAALLADPNAASAVSTLLALALAGALAVPIFFAACLFACSSASVDGNFCCCALSRPGNTAPWKDGAPPARWRFLITAWCYAQGLSLVAAGIAMPWLSISADVTLPVMASSGLLACDLGGVLLAALCNGAKLAAAGLAFLYASIALGAAAWIILWVLTIRARQLQQGALPSSAICGSLPAALYVGLSTTLLSLVGCALSWAGYNEIFGSVPKLGAPPGGVAVIGGTLLFFLANGCLWWAHAALGGVPVPHMTGEEFLSCGTVDDEEPPWGASASVGGASSRVFSQRLDLEHTKARAASSEAGEQWARPASLHPESVTEEQWARPAGLHPESVTEELRAISAHLDVVAPSPRARAASPYRRHFEERALAVRGLRERVIDMEAQMEEEVEEMAGEMAEVEARLEELRGAAGHSRGTRASASPPRRHSRGATAPSQVERLEEELRTLRLEKEIRDMRARAGERRGWLHAVRRSYPIKSTRR
jgi:hypothetical protein